MSVTRKQVKSDVQDLLPFFFSRRDEVDQIIDAIIDLAVEEAVDILRGAPPE